MRIPDRKDRDYIMCEDNWYDKTVDFLNDCIRVVEDFFFSIGNIIRWLPILWKDRDWDHMYLFYIMEFKMQNMANHLAKFSHHACKDRDVRTIKECIEHFKRVKDIHKYTEPYDMDWKFEPTEDGRAHRMTIIQSKYDEYKMKRTHNLEEWHWSEFFKKFTKWSRAWWD